MLSNYALREREGSILATVRGIRSGIYTVTTFHHGPTPNHGINIYITDYNETWSRRQVASDFIGSHGAVADNSIFEVDVVVNGTHDTSLIIEVEILTKTGSSVSWGNYLVLNGIQIQEKLLRNQFLEIWKSLFSGLPIRKRNHKP